MLAFYDEEDHALGSTKGKDWDELVIRTIRFHREDAFDKSDMQIEVRKVDGRPEDGHVYNHYVPHSRIVRALVQHICNKNMTRAQAFKWLVGVTDKLGLEPDPILKLQTQKIAGRYDFDAYVEWAFDACADFHETSSTAALRLRKAIGDELSLEPTVKIESYERAWPGPEGPEASGRMWYRTLSGPVMPENDDGFSWHHEWQRKK
ncbi:hypothetical protein FA10DRAFT_289431 [Acaromyces ingoldii]|uniref:Uncharacterized protein n=1 Tax=Acaromyces ingoldii TaxID=215250 RepID=A0A316YDB6_9BASI|nr:hypothetical protein FA10DRAFT_289431 [Acaromyces ingoldii]PWN86844.1 hypothetical protein FA10DRAFT_289431 [Acaromyces ingoldii]